MTPKDTKKAVENIPKRKLKEVDALNNLIKNKKTILIASIKNIPASQFQEIGKKLRGIAIVKVPKKNLIFRAIDSSGNKIMDSLKEQITESVALLFSDLDSFDLAAELIKNKSPSKAKAGQEAPEDIEIPEGPTELVPGPAISELGALGIQIQIEKGKIHIKEARVIAKKGKKITQAAADLMGKLDIKPFSIGFLPIAAFDTQQGKLYLNINIDPESTIKDLKENFGKALAFAVEIEYICEDTIKFLISKAGSHEKAFDNLLAKNVVNVNEDKTVNIEETKVEDNKEYQSSPEGETNKESKTPENKSGEENK
ncbi:MAG: 50S ribosomal protein L10 [archaeon]